MLRCDQRTEEDAVVWYNIFDTELVVQFQSHQRNTQTDTYIIVLSTKSNVNYICIFKTVYLFFFLNDYVYTELLKLYVKKEMMAVFFLPQTTSQLRH